MLRFYVVLIGTEILNGRREDAHFEFVRNTLEQYNHEIHSLSIIKDDPQLIKQSFSQALNDDNAILLSFGGIGSTPDDITRKIAAEVFRDSKMEYHKDFMNDIYQHFGEITDHRVEMAHLPINAQLLKNPVNNMSGFFLDKKYFFVPGFPSMAHPMIKQALSEIIAKSEKKYRRTLSAACSENILTDLMLKVPFDVELSSLPSTKDNTKEVTISLSSYNENLTNEWFENFVTYLDKNGIYHKESESLK